jgi:biofilm PGA synthesis N-glycosyltransferase PgaC
MSNAATVLFLLGVVYLIYVLFGYPLWLGVRARRARPVRSASFEPPVTVILAVHNGERWISGKLDSLLRLDYPADRLQILVLSDGSTDGTIARASAYRSRGIEVVDLPRSGKAGAINAGLGLASGEILLFTDVRQPLAPDSLRYLTACFADPEVGAASGELVIGQASDHHQNTISLYWRYEKWIRKSLSRVDSVLGATGAIYAMRRELAKPMPADVLLDDVYLPLLAFFAGYRVVFEERALAFDVATSLNTEFGRKVRTQAGVYQLLRYFPQLLGPANRMRFDFVSHKLGRLMLPFALLTIAICSFGLPGRLSALCIGGQCLFYFLALIDLILPEKFPLKRISAPVATFVTLVAAAFMAVSIFFRPAGSLWSKVTIPGRAPASQAAQPREASELPSLEPTSTGVERNSGGLR